MMVGFAFQEQEEDGQYHQSRNCTNLRDQRPGTDVLIQSDSRSSALTASDTGIKMYYSSPSFASLKI